MVARDVKSYSEKALAIGKALVTPVFSSKEIDEEVTSKSKLSFKVGSLPAKEAIMMVRNVKVKTG